MAKKEDIFGEEAFVFGEGEVEVAAQEFGGAGDKFVFAQDGGDLLEHGFALVGIDPEAGNHV